MAIDDKSHNDLSRGPLSLSELVFDHTNCSLRVEMLAPLSEENLLQIKPSTTVIHFAAKFTDPECQRINEAFKIAPHAKLRLWQSAEDLEVLIHFPDVTRLELCSALYEPELLSIYAPGLIELSIRVPQDEPSSLTWLPRMHHLRKLSLIGYWEGGIRSNPEFVSTFDAIGDLPNLEILNLHCLRIPQLAILKQMPKLKSLTVGQCLVQDIAGIGSTHGLMHLCLAYLYNNDLNFLSKTMHLQYLSLEHLSRVESVPSFEHMINLRRVVLKGMKKLIDLKPIAVAPSLQDLILDRSLHLNASDLQCFEAHPSLKHVWTDLGSEKKNRAVTQLLMLPRAGARSRFDLTE